MPVPSPESTFAPQACTRRRGGSSGSADFSVAPPGVLPLTLCPGPRRGTMWRWLRWPVRLLVLILVLGAGVVWHQWNFKPWSLDVFYQRAFLQYAIDDPQ